MNSFFEVLLGAVVSIIITIIFEATKRPSLKITTTKKIEKKYDQNPDFAKKAIFIYGHVINKTLPKFLRFLGRDEAIRCRGQIIFYNLDGTPIFGYPMPIRWSNSEEPIYEVVRRENGVEYRRFKENLHNLQFIDIAPGVSEPFDIVAKINDEKEIYGWSNETYIWSFKHEPELVWRNQDRLLTQGSFFAEVIIYNSTTRTSKFFKIMNPSEPSEFQVVEIARTDEKKIRKLIKKHPVPERTIG